MFIIFLLNYLIKFKYRKITDSDNIFQEYLFSKGKEMIELDLSDNFLTKLPNDLSCLENLHILDITNNPFENVTLF